MALIKCQECGKEVSSKAFACPNCGFPINKQNNQLSDIDKNSSRDLYVLVPRMTYSIAPSIVFIVLGALLSWALIGIVFIVLGICSICELNQNNKNPYCCAYYDASTQEIIIVSYNGLKYRVKPSDIIDNSHPFGDADMYVKIRINNKYQRINCGVCLREESVQFKEYYRAMQKGSFNPVSLPIAKDVSI